MSNNRGNLHYTCPTWSGRGPTKLFQSSFMSPITWQTSCLPPPCLPPCLSPITWWQTSCLPLPLPGLRTAASSPFPPAPSSWPSRLLHSRFMSPIKKSCLLLLASLITGSSTDTAAPSSLLCLEKRRISWKCKTM